MSDARELVKLEGITKDYPKLSKGSDRLRTLASLLLWHTGEVPHFRALRDVGLQLRQGDSLGLVGENGAGKSTLLKIIAGVVRPTAGSVQVNGRIGALLELGSGFHPEYTGRENIHLSGALMGLSRRELRGKIDSIIEFADIGEHIDEPIKHYSSGMVVRLGFAVATALEPDVLITDEVLAVGDESFQKKCIAWVERYLASGGTFLFCSHSMYHVQTLCANALWLHHGAARMYGNSFDVTQEYLAYHEERESKASSAARLPEGPYARITRIGVEDDTGAPADTFQQGQTLWLQGEAYGPDDRPPVILFGILRADGTSVFGSHSNERGFQPERASRQRFTFGVRFPEIALLPGKYRLKVHALDPEGLRLFDTVETTFVVRGKTRDYGLVALPHEWTPGRVCVERIRG